MALQDISYHSTPQFAVNCIGSHSLSHSAALLNAPSWKLQHKLSLAILSGELTNLLASVESGRDAAHIQSLQGPSAGAWLDSIPSSSKFALSPTRFHLAAYLRLRIQLPFNDWGVFCDCDAVLDKGGFLLLTCKLGGGPF